MAEIPVQSSQEQDIYSFGFDLNLNKQVVLGADQSGYGQSTSSVEVGGVFIGSILQDCLIANSILFDNKLDNVLIGRNALNLKTTGSNNIAIGFEVLNNNTTGFNNIGLGYQVLLSNTTGNNNVAIGESALSNNTTGGGNIAIGEFALGDNTTGNRNVAVGFNALFLNQTGFDNTAIGETALYNNTGDGNTAVGEDSLLANTTGSYNTGIGRDALNSNTTGDRNVAIGMLALPSNTTGIRNTALGSQALYNNTTGDYHVGVGWDAGPTTGALTNTIAIGKNSSVAASNTMVLGGTGADAVSVAIGRTTASATLHMTVDNAVTATVTDLLILNHSSSGTPAANFGTGLLFTGESTTTDNSNMARIQAIWSTATHASRASSLEFQTLTGAGSLTSNMALYGNGDLEVVGKIFSNFSGARVYHSVNQSINSGAWTLKSFDTESFDTDAYHSTSVNTDRLTAPRNGYYRLHAHCDFASSATTTGQRTIRIDINGATVQYGDDNKGNDAGVNGLEVSTTYYMASGDYANVYVYQDSTIALNAIGGSADTIFEIEYLGDAP